MTSAINRPDFTVFTTIPSPYKHELFEQLAQRGHSFEVLYQAREARGRYWQTPIRFGYTANFPRSYRLPSKRPQWITPRFCGRALTAAEPLVFHGWENVTLILAWLLRALVRKPYCLWSETWDPRASRAEGVLAMARTRLLRQMFGRAQAVWVPGRQARKYALAHGARESRLHVVPTTWSQETVNRLASEESPVRRRLNLGFLGRRSFAKGFDLFLEIAQRAWASSLVTGIHVAGDGAEAFEVPEVGAIYKDWGWLETDGDKANFFAEIDVLLLPSRHDTWCLVLLEATSAGICVVASDRVGAAYDLIEDGVTGRMIPLDGFVDETMRLLAEPCLAREMARAASRVNVSYEANWSSIEAAVRSLQ